MTKGQLLAELAQGDVKAVRDRNRLADALVIKGYASVVSGAYGNKKVMTYIYSITEEGRRAVRDEAE